MDTVPQITGVKKSAEPELLHRPGVTAVDVGYKYVKGRRTDKVAIRVFVEKKKKNVSKKEKIPETIDGVKTDVIERKYELQQFKNRKKLLDVELLVDTGRYRPLKGGMGLGPCRVVNGYVYVGTLGAIVKDNATGNPFCLSNFHVMCIDNGWQAGDQMCQPGRVDGGSCPADVIGTLQRAVLDASVDGAVCNINSGIGYGCRVLDIGSVTGTAAAVLGSAVRKRGRTTALTYGFVDGLAGSVKIDYGDGIGIKTLTGQITIGPDTAQNPLFSDHGDSGSVIMDANRKVVGLLFAGSSDGHTVANPIAAVLSALNISMCVGYVIKGPKEFKEYKIEKLEVEVSKNIIKDMLENPKTISDQKIFEIPKISEVGPINPDVPITHRLEARVAQLETTVGQLATFITSGMRPDLSAGALKQEPDFSDLGQQLQQQASDAAQVKTSADSGCS
jgi:hypothetical protein